MAKGDGLIVVQKGNSYIKLCKVRFGRDGSFMVMVPYHPEKKCTLFKMPVNYTTSQFGEPVPYDEIIDAGEVQKKEVKLSHHRSGFVQFSGDGILSGPDGKGSGKGIGIQSFALDNPAEGPSFSVYFWGLDDFDQVQNPPKGTLAFQNPPSQPILTADALVLEGFYLPPKCRSAVREVNGCPMIMMAHPRRGLVHLPVHLAAQDAELPGLIAFRLDRQWTLTEQVNSGFVISGSTGNLRTNEKGENLGDGIFCACPGNMRIPRRDLNFVGAESTPPPVNHHW